MDSPVWLRRPFQLLDFVLIGDSDMTLNKVTNGIARMGLLAGLILLLMDNKSWWLVALTFLLVSMFFYYASIYIGCHASSITMTGTRVEGFQPTPSTQVEGDTLAVTYAHVPTNDQSDIEYLEPPRFHASMTEVQSSHAQIPTVSEKTLGETIMDVYQECEQDAISDRESQVNDHARRLQLNLTPDDFTANYFEPYTIYQPNETLYASLSVAN